MEAGPSVKEIIKTVHNPVERKKWDKDVEVAEVLKVTEKGDSLLWYQRQVSKVKLIN